MASGDSPRPPKGPPKRPARRAALPYDAAFCEQVVAFMGQGYSLTAFAGEIGAARSTVNGWIVTRAAFAEAVERGRAARTRALETELLAAESGAKVTAHLFALKNASPEDWRERPDVDAAAPAAPPATVFSLPDNERR